MGNSESSRPRVALHSGAFALLSDELRSAVDAIELRSDDDYVLDALADVRFIAPGPRHRRIAKLLPDMGGLEVFQTATAGVDRIEPVLPPGTTLCSARGTRDASVAEWVVGALLGTSSQILQRAGATQWEFLQHEDLGSWKVLIVGMGSIGRRVATLLGPFGTEVVGIVLRAREDLHGIDELAALLPQADAVVLLTPLSEATEHLIGVAELSAMKDNALLINAARGRVVDTDALVAELQRGRLRAVLDVTDPEPLPPGHPLWSAPGLLSITPHMAGGSPGGHENAARLAVEQLGRWLRGEALVNVVVAGEVG